MYILDPMEKNTSLAEAQEVWQFLGESFPNILTEDQLQRLLFEELPRYYS